MVARNKGALTTTSTCVVFVTYTTRDQVEKAVQQFNGVTWQGMSNGALIAAPAKPRGPGVVYPVDQAAAPAKLGGQDLAGGFTAYLFSLKLPHFSLARGPCTLCRRENSGDLTWTNFQRNAPWVDTIWRKADWHLWPERSQNPLFQLPGQSCHLVSLDMFGSVPQILCQFVLPGADADNVRTCWTFLKSYYKQRKIPPPYRYLNKITMFLRQGKFPKLRGKAAEVRHLSEPISALWKHYVNQGSEVHRQIDLMLRLNASIERTLTEHSRSYCLPPLVYNKFVNDTYHLLEVSAALWTWW